MVDAMIAIYAEKLLSTPDFSANIKKQTIKTENNTNKK
ncbi:hypothetical protein CSC03_4377 [Enterobacter hormaechei]|nr:hypothetical protein CSC03_4377 [Enterobacter hormaechei]